MVFEKLSSWDWETNFFAMDLQLKKLKSFINWKVIFWNFLNNKPRKKSKDAEILYHLLIQLELNRFL